MPDVHSVLPFVKKERIILQYFLIPVNKNAIRSLLYEFVSWVNIKVIKSITTEEYNSHYKILAIYNNVPGTTSFC